jgi:stage III sporulation protein AE
MIDQQTNMVNTDEVEHFWNELMHSYGSYFPKEASFSFRDVLFGQDHFELSMLGFAVAKFFLHEVWLNGKLLASCVLLTVFCLVLQTLQSSFERNHVSKLAYMVTFLVLMVLLVNSFRLASDYALNAITSMVSFMMAMVPILLTLLASMGHLSTVMTVHPLLIFMIHTGSLLIQSVVFPLLFFSTLLHLVSALSEKYKLTSLANLLRQCSLVILAVFVAIFLGVISVQSTAGVIRDGVLIRTAKYVAGNFVPIVGRLFSDATDTVIGASLLVKNAVGISGVLILVLLCMFPACKIIAIACLYYISSAVLQPLGEHPITTCLQTMGKNTICLFAAVAAIGFMFFLAITIMIALSNVSVMIR